VSDLDKRIYDADQARLVLENPAFAQAFNDVKQEIIESWENSPARDQEGREKLYQLLKLADKLQLTLRRSLESGQLAKAELHHQQTMLERAKQAVGWS
jgi:hypothetical protein